MTVTDILKKLITFPTVTGDTLATEAALSWIKDQVGQLPVQIQELQSNIFPSLIITTQQTKSPKVWLVAHLDVVPGSDSVFNPREENGRLYGRGAYDMKFALACYLKLLSDLGQSITKYDFGLMITTDEEIGGANGVKFLLEQDFGGQVAILPDGGTNWQLESGAKGRLEVRVKSSGKPAHASRPWEGQSALVQLMTYLQHVIQAFPEEPCGDPTHNHPTVTVTTLHSGEAVNQVPDAADAILDIRFVSVENYNHVLGVLKTLQEKFTSIELEIVQTAYSYQTDFSHELVQAFAQLVAEVKGQKLSTIISHGSSDARFFLAKSIPTIVTRPLGDGLHSESEWIDTDNLQQFYELLKKFVVRHAQLSAISETVLLPSVDDVITRG